MSSRKGHCRSNKTQSTCENGTDDNSDSVANGSRTNGTIYNAPAQQSTDERLSECLRDKASVPYQNSLEFAETIAFTECFSKQFSLTPVRYAKLEQALEAETGNTDLLLTRRENDAKGLSNLVVPPPIRSPLLRQLFGELLTALGHRVDQASSNEHFTQVLWRALRVWAAAGRELTGPIDDTHFASFINECGSEEREVCCWPAEMKLALVRTAINALLSSSNHVDVCEGVLMEDLRVPPFAIDKQWRKYWHFGDTYLFMEEPIDDSQSAGRGNESPQPTPKRRKKRSIGKSAAAKKKKPELGLVVDREKEEANAQLLTSYRLRIVCKTADDWERLAAIYSDREEKEVAEALCEMGCEVQELEQKRLKEELFIAAAVRTSTRVQQKREVRQREEERLREMREQQAQVEREERRRMLLYARSDRQSVLSAYEGVQTSELDREERMRLREQRKAEQQAEAVDGRRSVWNEASSIHHTNGYSPSMQTSANTKSLSNGVSTSAHLLNPHPLNHAFHQQRYYDQGRLAGQSNHDRHPQNHLYPSTSNTYQSRVPLPNGFMVAPAAAYYHRSPYAKLGERGIVVVVDTMEAESTRRTSSHHLRVLPPIGHLQRNQLYSANSAPQATIPTDSIRLKANRLAIDHDHCYARALGGETSGKDNVSRQNY